MKPTKFVRQTLCKMKKIILLVGIIGILLISFVYAKGGGVAYPCYGHNNVDPREIIKNYEPFGRNVYYLNAMSFVQKRGCFPNYNFGKVTYHEMALGYGVDKTHYY